MKPESNEKNTTIDTETNEAVFASEVPIQHDNLDLLAEALNLFGKGVVENLKTCGLSWEEEFREQSKVFDSTEKSYLDCYTLAGSYNLGRKNPEIISEFKRAIRETDQGNFIMISREKADLAEALANFMGNELQCSLFTVVRGEAMDAACKLARGYTGRSELITVDGGWYGQTGFALSLSQRREKSLFGNLIPDIQTIPFNDKQAALEAISTKTAAVLLEPIQAENCCRTVDKSYLEEIHSACDKAGALLILDESQSGFGRTGSRFYADFTGVCPDIMLLGEAMSGGMFPIGAMVFTKKIKHFFDEHPLIHLHTFGGHDIGCRVALKTLELYQRIKPWENAAYQGARLKERLQQIAGKNSNIDSVAGVGLLLSIHFRSEETALESTKSMIKQGLLVKRGEVAKNSIVIRPPLVISDTEIDEIAEKVAKACR